MIKFYYFDSNARDMARPGFRVRGVHGPMAVCQVYSDKSVRELRVWGRNHQVPKPAIHRHEGLMPHVDLYGTLFKLGGEGVSRDVFVADVAGWDGRPDR